jgi:hypothetical protein
MALDGHPRGLWRFPRPPGAWLPAIDRKLGLRCHPFGYQGIEQRGVARPP